MQGRTIRRWHSRKHTQAISRQPVIGQTAALTLLADAGARKTDGGKSLTRRMGLLRKIFYFILVAAWLFISLDLLWPVLFPIQASIPAEKPPGKSGVNYLVIAPQAFSGVAAEWAAYRQASGFQAATVLLSPEQKTPQAIAQLIQETYYQSGSPYPFYVILLGPPYSHANADIFLPPHKFKVAAPITQLYGYEYILGDSGYTFDEQRKQWLPIAIGRIPFEEEVLIHQALSKTKRYEMDSANGLSALQVNLTASDAAWGDAFGKLAETMLRQFAGHFISPDINFKIVYGFSQSAYSLPTDQYASRINESLNGSPLWWTYVGHGGDALGPAIGKNGEWVDMYDSNAALSMPDVNQTIATFVACTLGDYERPSFSHLIAMLPQGPVAVFAASDITFDVPNTFLQRDLMTLALNKQVETVGEWTRLAKFGYQHAAYDRTFFVWLLHQQLDELYNRTIVADCDATDVFTEQDAIEHQLYGYNLFGDPALHIKHAKRDLEVTSRLAGPFDWGEIYVHGKSALPQGTPIAVWLKPFPGSRLDVQPESDPVERFEQANRMALAATMTQVEAGGTFEGNLRTPGLALGKYVVTAASLSAPTVVGHDILYVGLPWQEWLTNRWLWWTLISFSLFSLYRAKSKNT